jgi:hypothetical protein
LALVRNIAGAFGIAIFGSVLSNATENRLLDIAKYSVINTANPMLNGEFRSLIILKAQITSFSTVYVVSAMVVLVGALLSLQIRIPKDRELGKLEGPIE